MLKSKLQDLRQYAGDLSGLYGMREYTFNEGRARGMRGIDVINGKNLRATFLPDRCMDIASLHFKGYNVGLVTKAGLSSPVYYTPDGSRSFLTQFNAGLLTTCGIMNAGIPCEADGRFHPQHGEIGNTPCSNVCKQELEVDDEIVLSLSGEARQACVFAEYLTLFRNCLIRTESDEIQIRDTIQNKGFSPAPVMSLYHINFGYPMLDEGAQLFFSAKKVEPRDDVAKKELDKHRIIERPTPNRPEACFTHTGGEPGINKAMIYNAKLGIAAAVEYDSNALPYLHEWKSMASGDYALGLEPSAAGFAGLAKAKENGQVKYLEPGATIEFSLSIKLMGDERVIREYIESIER